MDTYYLFSTPLLEFRPFTQDDLPALNIHLNHPDLTGRRYLPEGFPDSLPLSTAQVENILKKWGEKENGFVYAVIDQQNQEIIGHVEADWSWDAISPGISVVINPLHQREGLGSEALSLLLGYLYENTVAHNVSSWMADWNTAARAFAAKHGFSEAGLQHLAGVRGGRYFHEVTVDILRPEWQKIKGGA
jgi:RimJ/RimL family protein N-acetyltransferase